MKYCILIMDGASGWPLINRDQKTCLALADSQNLDAMAREALVGLVRTVPPEMEPSSACACMSVLGYNPELYYHGRSAIEAKGMGIPVSEGEVIFRCNLVAVRDGKMLSYSVGHISTEEAKELIASLNKNLGSDRLHFYSGVSYRHLCKMKAHENTLLATCTPPHDIPGKPIKEFLPHGPGSNILRDLMARSESILQNHPVNIARRARGDIPATMIWLFWSSGKIPDMPLFKDVYNVDAALSSGVDVLRGLATMTGIKILDIPGVTDGLDNNYAAQATGALEALEKYDMVVIHVEAPDEAGHAGSVEDKIEAIERIDKEIVNQLRSWNKDALRVLILPDHPTPISIQTHVAEPVPFVLWGPGIKVNGARRFTEAEAKSTGILINDGYTIIDKLIH